MKGTPLTEKTHNYICNLFPAEDDFLRNLNKEAEEAQIPAIHISPDQVAVLQVMLTMMNAKHVIEVGSLAGYSTIAMARALQHGGTVDAFEISEKHGDFIRRKAEEAGLSEVINVHVGNAQELLKDFQPNYTIDAVFIDADKKGYVKYMDYTFPLLRKGGVIIGDNALAWGNVADEDTEDETVQAIQRFNKAMSQHPHLQGCMIPVGDGMACGIKTIDKE